MNPNQMQIPMQPMPVQYTICRSRTPGELEQEVNRKLGAGFTLHGPTFVSGEDYIQPLVKLALKPIAMGTEEKAPIVHEVSSGPLFG